MATRRSDELLRLEQLFPDWPSIPYRRRAAKDRAVSAAWRPPSAQRVLDVIHNGPEDLRSAFDELRVFFEERFGSDLRMFVADLPDGQKLLNQVVEQPASPAQLAVSATKVLHRNNRINGALFEALKEQRPVFRAGRSLACGPIRGQSQRQ